MVEQLWKTVASEYKIDDIGYLNINPRSVRVSSFNLVGSVLNLSVGISASPVITTASGTQSLKPLPNLTSYVPAKGFNIYLDLVEDYQHPTTVIKQKITGQKC